MSHVPNALWPLPTSNTTLMSVHERVMSRVCMSHVTYINDIQQIPHATYVNDIAYITKIDDTHQISHVRYVNNTTHITYMYAHIDY